MFEHAKIGNIMGKKPSLSFVEKGFYPYKPKDAFLTTRGASGQAPMVQKQANSNKNPKKYTLVIYVVKKAIQQKTTGIMLVDSPSRLNILVRSRGVLH